MTACEPERLLLATVGGSTVLYESFVKFDISGVGAFADVFGWVVSFEFLATLLVAVLLAISRNVIFELAY